uniref:Uncharacterized protein n=1 Tax=Candidatus Kentrum sp. LPFa TaxID=2126335 RepID=A0A450WYD5_9GAMM|nr:MAG: hypothetical protein BECKLPF1236A_GA0070988_103294 [Candidatus Kentron sp. LPFa]VFK26309.1 MAG: hypothetical protein BECKLPF1236C_GA0070990_1003318 [Candidatus Kentron sp. LPFa]
MALFAVGGKSGKDFFALGEAGFSRVEEFRGPLPDGLAGDEFLLVMIHVVVAGNHEDALFIYLLHQFQQKLPGKIVVLLRPRALGDIAGDEDEIRWAVFFYPPVDVFQDVAEEIRLTVVVTAGVEVGEMQPAQGIPIAGAGPVGVGGGRGHVVSSDDGVEYKLRLYGMRCSGPRTSGFRFDFPA